MNKIQSLKKLSEIVNDAKKQGKTVGLITGCFDVLHVGHLERFDFAKKKVDLLVVGLENDETVKRSKGHDRPIFGQKARLYVIANLALVDFVFLVRNKYCFGNKETLKIHTGIYKRIKPDFLFTNKDADSSWEIKKDQCKLLNIKIVCQRKKRVFSSTRIIKRIRSEL